MKNIIFAIGLMVMLTGCGMARKTVTAQDLEREFEKWNMECTVPADVYESQEALNAENPENPVPVLRREPENPVSAAPAAPAVRKEPEKKLSGFDLDALIRNTWIIAAVFLLIQWFEIWYFNRTGRTSKTIDAVEELLNVRLGYWKKLMYRVWRRNYFKKHPDKMDPDNLPDQTKERKDQ